MHERGGLPCLEVSGQRDAAPQSVTSWWYLVLLDECHGCGTDARGSAIAVEHYVG